MKIENLPSGFLSVNTYLVYDEVSGKGFIVDPGGYDERMVRRIKENGISPEYIILTHGHSDHIGGVLDYCEKYKGIKVVSSAAEADMLSDPSRNQSVMWTGIPVSIIPDITALEGDVIEVGNMTLRFTMTPGHTKGGMCVIVGDVVFSGDTLFRDSIGRTDFEGGSYEELVRSVHEKLFVLPDETVVLPGHMMQTTIGHEKEHNPFV